MGITNDLVCVSGQIRERGLKRATKDDGGGEKRSKEMKTYCLVKISFQETAVYRFTIGTSSPDHTFQPESSLETILQAKEVATF